MENLAKPGYNHICFAVTDLDAEVRRLTSQGVTLRTAILDFHARKLCFSPAQRALRWNWPSGTLNLPLICHDRAEPLLTTPRTTPRSIPSSPAARRIVQILYMFLRLLCLLRPTKALERDLGVSSLLGTAGAYDARVESACSNEIRKQVGAVVQRCPLTAA